MESGKSPLGKSISSSLSGTNLQSLKHNDLENESTVPGLIIAQNARVEIENECKALRETVSHQQQTIQELSSDLEQERNASSSAANEAMSMILKLQREKAEIEMETRQFQRFAEEKMVHDEQEMSELEELLYKREHAIEALNCEVQTYRHRLMSYGVTEAEIDEVISGNGDRHLSRNTSMTDVLDGQFEIPSFDIYPRLKCKTNESHVYHDGDDETEIERSAFDDTPYSRDQLRDLEFRINQLEHSPRTNQPDSAKNVFEAVIASQSPLQPKHLMKFVPDSPYSPFAADSPKFGNSIKKTVYSHLDFNSNLRKVDNALEFGDEMNDRIYTIDSIHQRATVNAAMDVTSMESLIHPEMRDLEIQKLYARLHALEADRETMRQAIVSVGTDKAQLILLKEIAQNLCKEMAQSGGMAVHKHSVGRSFSIISIFKWILSFIFWRRKARQCRNTFGLSANNTGLLLLLDRRSRVGLWRSVSTRNMRN